MLLWIQLSSQALWGQIQKVYLHRSHTSHACGVSWLWRRWAWEQHPPWSLHCVSWLLSCPQLTRSHRSQPLLLLLGSTHQLFAKPLSNDVLQDRGWRALPSQAGLWPGLSCPHHKNKEAFDATRKQWELQFSPLLCQIYCEMPMAEHWLSSIMAPCPVCYTDVPSPASADKQYYWKSFPKQINAAAYCANKMSVSLLHFLAKKNL